MKNLLISRGIRYILVFLSLLAAFTIGLVLVFCIPNGLISANQQVSMEFIGQEGHYPQIYFQTDASQLDNYTDELMLDTTIVEDESLSPLQAAMDMDSYARYWHGYQIILRPALVFFSYEQIRYLYILLFFVLLTATILALRKKLGIPAVFAFVISLCMLYILVLPASMQFSHVFMLTFAGILILLWRYDPERKQDWPLFFLVIGMLVNFVDLLTAPLLTLGMPLLVYFALEFRYHPEAKWRKQFATLFGSSLAWGIGYGGCWLSKWLIASPILHRNVVMEALNAILFRTGGSEEYPLERIEMFRKNLDFFLGGPGRAIPYVWLAVLIFFAAILLLFSKEKKRLPQALFFLIVALYPYAWFFVLANHSDIHAWFTYRIQGITAFGILLFLFTMTDWKRLGDTVKKIPVFAKKN
ncbi:MAG: hypothetical protein ACOX6P_04150 [Candidatus Merdivicinus sp.]